MSNARLWIDTTHSACHFLKARLMLLSEGSTAEQVKARPTGIMWSTTLRRVVAMANAQGPQYMNLAFLMLRYKVWTGVTWNFKQISQNCSAFVLHMLNACNLQPYSLKHFAWHFWLVLDWATWVTPVQSNSIQANYGCWTCVEREKKLSAFSSFPSLQETWLALFHKAGSPNYLTMHFLPAVSVWHVYNTRLFPIYAQAHTNKLQTFVFRMRWTRFLHLYALDN